MRVRGESERERERKRERESVRVREKVTDESVKSGAKNGRVEKEF